MAAMAPLTELHPLDAPPGRWGRCRWVCLRVASVAASRPGRSRDSAPSGGRSCSSRRCCTLDQSSESSQLSQDKPGNLKIKVIKAY